MSETPSVRNLNNKIVNATFDAFDEWRPVADTPLK